MAGLPPSEFAARLTRIRDGLAGLAQTAADGVLDGMNNIAESAVKRLVERTPRSEHDDVFLEVAIGSGKHIADGWTARKVDAGSGVFSIEVVNVDPRAIENVRLADGTVTDYTLLEILEYGSKPHEIVPVNAPFLHFFARSGDEVYAQKVNHPGTREYAMVAITATEAALDLKRLIDATRRTLTLKQIGRI